MHITLRDEAYHDAALTKSMEPKARDGGCPIQTNGECGPRPRPSKKFGGSAMRYRVYSGPKGSDDIAPIGRETMLFKEFAGLDEALSWAGHVEKGGRVPLLIEGDDGTRMNRRAIADALGAGMRERVGGQSRI
jgi:hypothetical protein